jgi:hypothetical protein
MNQTGSSADKRITQCAIVKTAAWHVSALVVGVVLGSAGLWAWLAGLPVWVQIVVAIFSVACLTLTPFVIRMDYIINREKCASSYLPSSNTGEKA